MAGAHRARLSAAGGPHADPLVAATPAGWVEAAAAGWQDLLLDHANCEKKAASTALALMFAYPEQQRDNLAFARLAREELRHFEQVTRMMERLGVAHRRLAPGRYAAGLRAAVRTSEPARRLDLLLVGALIEARSCERFRLLADALAAKGDALAAFYDDLFASEARHYRTLVDLAIEVAGDEAAVRARLADLAEQEGALGKTLGAHPSIHG